MLQTAVRLLRRHLFTRENAWAVLICLMLALIFIAWTLGVQPHFMYGGF